MTKRSTLVLAIWAIVSFAVVWSSVAAEAKTPTQAYLDYRETVVKAKTLAEVLPHLSKEYRGMLQSQPKKDEKVWLERLRETAAAKDMKITKETIDGAKCTLEGTATSARGNKLRGKISLVKEAGAWKLDEEGWATSGD